MSKDDKPRKLVELTEDDLHAIIDKRITEALKINPADLTELPGDPGVMSTPSVLSTVRATAYVMC